MIPFSNSVWVAPLARSCPRCPWRSNCPTYIWTGRSAKRLVRSSDLLSYIEHVSPDFHDSQVELDSRLFENLLTEERNLPFLARGGVQEPSSGKTLTGS